MYSCSSSNRQSHHVEVLVLWSYRNSKSRLMVMPWTQYLHWLQSNIFRLMNEWLRFCSVWFQKNITVDQDFSRQAGWGYNYLGVTVTFLGFSVHVLLQYLAAPWLKSAHRGVVLGQIGWNGKKRHRSLFCTADVFWAWFSTQLLPRERNKRLSSKTRPRKLWCSGDLRSQGWENWLMECHGGTTMGGRSVESSEASRATRTPEGMALIKWLQLVTAFQLSSKVG